MSKTSKTPEQAADTCPVCGHKDLIYGDSELQDESYIYSLWQEWIIRRSGN